MIIFYYKGSNVFRRIRCFQNRTDRQVQLVELGIGHGTYSIKLENQQKKKKKSENWLRIGKKLELVPFSFFNRSFFFFKLL